MAETFGPVFAPSSSSPSPISAWRRAGVFAPSPSPISAGRGSGVFALSPSPTSAGRGAGLNYPHAPASTPSPASLWRAAAVDHQQAPASTLSPPPPPAKGGVLAAIVATIATTILISFLVFYMLRRCLARRGNSRDSRPTVFPERERQEGAPKGAILDDSGLDLVYWRKIHGIHQIKMEKASHRERLRSDGSLSSSSQAYADEKTEFEMLPVPDSVGKPPAVMPESTANSAWKPPRVSNAGTPQRQTVPVLNVNPSPSRYPNSTASARTSQATPITTWPDSELDPRGGINSNTPQPPNMAEHPPRPQQSMMCVNSAQKTQTVLQSSQSSPSYSTIPLPSQSLARPPLPPHPMMYAGPAQIKPQNDASSTPQSPPPSSSSSIAARPPPPSSQLESRPPLPPPPMMYVNSAPKSQKDVNSTPTSAPHLIERPVPTSAPMPLPPPSPLPQSEARPPPPPPPPPVTAASQPPTPPPSATKKPNTESQTPPVTGKAPPPPPVPGKAPPPPGKAPPPPRIGPLAKAPTAAKAKEKQNAQESSPEPMPKLKPLHWDKVAIPANSDHSMVWRRLREGSFSFDSDQMEALFGLGDPNTKSPAPSKTVPLANRSTNQVFLLDPRRSQNTAIVLRSIALPRETIVDSLLHGRDLAADVLEKLARIAPTLDDISAIRACPSDSVAQLADAESFLYDLLKAVPTAFRRVDAMLFRSSYDSEIHIFNENLQILGLACNELKSCTLFFRLLEVILKAGNQMNAGTERGNAQAFNLRTLSKLADVKSTDGKTTLLYFVVQEVVRAEGKKRAITREQSTRQPGSSRDQTMPRKEEIDQEYLTLGLPVVSGLSTELTNVKKAAGVEYEFVASCCNKLGVKVGEIKKFVSNLSGDEFKEEMDVFVAGAEKELQVLREDQNRVTDLVKKTIQYYHAGTGKDRPENLLQLFVIVKDFLNMVDQVCVEISKSLQRKKTHAGSAGPSTAVATAVRSSPRFANLPVHFVTENSRGSSDSDEEF